MEENRVKTVSHEELMVLLHQENIRWQIQELHYELIPHSLYTPDLDHSNFFLTTLC